MKSKDLWSNLDTTTPILPILGLLLRNNEEAMIVVKRKPAWHNGILLLT